MARTQAYYFNGSNPFQQLGVTLVELIIAMGLGVAILGAAIQFSLSSHQLSGISSENNILAQNARLAQAIISRDLRMGGYRGLGEGNLPAPFLSLDCGDSACTADGGGSNNDKIAVVYESANDDLASGKDCMGTVANAGQLIANQYYIQTVDNISSLMCRSFDVVIAAATTVTARAGAPVALIDGIESMQFLYGITSNTGGTTRFVNAGDVADWGKVKAVRLAFLVSDGLNQGSITEKQRSYTLLDADAKNYTDKITRHVFTTTVELNNTFKQ